MSTDIPSTTTTRNGGMGMGRYAWLGNASAMMVICVGFLFGGKYLLDTAKDREQRFFLQMDQSIKAGQVGHDAANNLSRSVDTLSSEVRQLRKERQARAGELELAPHP